VLEGESFDPAHSQAQLRIAMSDYVARIVAPRLLAQVGESAPGMRIDTLAGTVADFCEALADRRADFAIGAYNDDVQRPGFLRSHRLWTVDFFCFMRSGHPLGRFKKMPLGRFLGARHLDVGLAGNRAAIYDLVLQRRGLKRNLVSTVSHYATAYEVVRRSDLIAVLPWSEGLEMTRLAGLQRVRPPLAAPARTIELFWHERHETSAPHQWLRDRLIELFGRP
jgi:DNA-binding transcriptional LysR family regulator